MWLTRRIVPLVRARAALIVLTLAAACSIASRTTLPHPPEPTALGAASGTPPSAPPMRAGDNSRPLVRQGATACRVAPPSAPANTIPVVVYFTCNNVVSAVPRHIAAAADTTARIQAALAALVAGPTPAEQAAGFWSFFSADSAQIITSVTLSDPTAAVVDVSTTAQRIPNAATSNGLRTIVSQLSQTVFQFPEIDTVTLQMDGSCEAFWQWLESSCQPVPRPRGTEHREGGGSPDPYPAVAAPASSAAAGTARPSSALMPAGRGSLTWETLTVPIPPEHAWQPGVSPAATGYKVPIVATGRIVYAPVVAPEHLVEQPDGVGLCVLAFRGSLDDWLAHAASLAAARNPFDQTTVTETTVAGQAAVTYQYTVTGVSVRRYYAVKLEDEQLLLIENSDVDNPEYQEVVNRLQRAAP